MGKKQALSPNLIQKRFISGAGLNCRDWLVIGETAAELKIVSRATGDIRTIKKTAPAGKLTKRSK